MADDQKKLGPFLATMLVAGGMIGSGIYLLPASLAATGSISLLGWCLAVLGAALLAGVFSTLAILRPQSGGLFEHIAEAFGPGVGFVAGVLYWIPVANAPIALAVTGYLSFFLPQVATGPAATLTTLTTVWLFIGANFIGARFVARLGGWTLLIGLAPILLVAVGGWAFFKPAVFAASWNVSGKPDYQAIPSSAALAFWAFTGLEYASIVALRVQNPRRNVPVATFGGLALAAVVYLAACGVIMGILPAAVLAKSNAPFADAAAPWLGPVVAGVVALCAMLKSCGSLAAADLALIETGDSQTVLGQIVLGGGYRRPDRPSTFSLIFFGLIMSVVVIASASPTLAGQFTTLANITVIIYMLVYLAACLALIRFSGEVSARRRPLVRGVALCGAIFCCYMIASSERSLLEWSAAALVVTLLVYLVVRLRQRR